LYHVYEYDCTNSTYSDVGAMCISHSLNKRQSVDPTWSVCRAVDVR
jgi:hypothetical protein